jgi:hypothetical protein
MKMTLSYERSRIPSSYPAAVDMPRNIRRLVDSDPEQRMSALHCIGATACCALQQMFPDQGSEAVGDLLALWRDHSELVSLRMMALVVLSYVIPVRDDGGRQSLQTVVATLASLLPPAPGISIRPSARSCSMLTPLAHHNLTHRVIRSLADMAADRSAAAPKRAPDAPCLKRKRDQGIEVPAEVGEMLAARTSMQPGSQAHVMAQVQVKHRHVRNDDVVSHLMVALQLSLTTHTHTRA